MCDPHWVFDRGGSVIKKCGCVSSICLLLYVGWLMLIVCEICMVLMVWLCEQAFCYFLRIFVECINFYILIR